MEAKSITKTLMSTVEGIWQTAKSIAASRMFPGFDKPEVVMSVFLISEQMGFDNPTALLRCGFVVKGKLGLSADLMMGMCAKDPRIVCVRYDSDNNDKKATVYVDRKWPNGHIETYPGTFTIEEAKRAKLLAKENWIYYPKAMLLARAKAISARAAIPDVLAGCYTKEELEGLKDQSGIKNVTPLKNGEAVEPKKAAVDEPWIVMKERLEALKGHPLGGMEKVRVDALEKLKMDNPSFEKMELRVRKLEALKDVDSKEKTYIDNIIKTNALTAIRRMEEARRQEALKDVVPIIEDSKTIEDVDAKIEEDITAVTQKILKLVSSSEKLDGNVIGSHIDNIASTDDRKMALQRIQGYLKQLKGVGEE